MSTKYIIQKTEGVFFAGPGKIAEKGLTLKKYSNLQDVVNMIKALQFSASSLLFKGVSKGEQKKIISAGKSTSAHKKKARTKVKAKKKEKK